MTLQQLKYVIYIAESGSINKASEKAFISQPSLSAALKELEIEIGLTLFTRTNRGLVITAEGNEFLSYARQVVLQYTLMEEQYIGKKIAKKRFAVSTQHYSFAVKSFINMVNYFNMEEYDFSIIETKTHEVIEHVKFARSEIGILYRNPFNAKILNRAFEEQGLDFVSLVTCKVYVYLWKGNPLATYEQLEMDQLEPYPCLSFEQDDAFYFAEEVFSTYEYKRCIKANDRATMLNLMKGLNGYTFCTGIISEELNGEDYMAIPLNTDEVMEIGYLKKKSIPLSELALRYIQEIESLL